MNDKELADRIVALGVGASDHGYYEIELAPRTENTGRMTRSVKADVFVRDWRVAGALMEKCVNTKNDYTVSVERDVVDGSLFFTLVCGYTAADEHLGESESLPRAINEACVEALT